MSVAPEEVDETRMRQMLEHLPHFAVVIDRERRFRWVNRVDPTLTLDQIIGVRADDFVHPSSLGVLREAVTRAFDTGTRTTYVIRGYGDGEMATWYAATVVPLPKNAAGEERALVLTNDVTEHHADQEALLESERRFRSLTEASPDLIFIVDHDLRVSYVNRELPADVGIARSEVAGMRAAALVRADLREAAEATLRRVLETGEPATVEIVGMLDRRTYVCRVIRLQGEGSTAQALITATDVTSQRAAEAERDELETRLQRAQKIETIGQLAGGIAHDFNNLLFVVSTHLEFVRDMIASGEDPHEELDAIAQATRRARDLTRRLLAIGRRQRHEPRNFDLAGFLREGLTLVRSVIPESTEIHTEIGPEPLFVRADPGQIEQVLINLCLNARDAVEHGGAITIGAGRRKAPVGETGEWIAFRVCDTGHGMDEATLSRALEPFFTTRSQGKGTGLGLSVVHGIVSQNEGVLEIESEVAKGTRVVVSLREVVPEGTRATAESAAVRAPARGGETILVAEDEPVVRRAVVRILTRAGYRVLEAEHGQHAVEIFAEQKDGIDLVLLDAIMPVLGGRAAYDQLVRLQPDVKVIFCSGYAAETLPRAFLDAHGLLLLAKPYQPAALLGAIRRALHGE
jgi:PAS domain S-box-containing protein